MIEASEFKLANLFVTQDGYRNINLVKKLKQFVSSGGVFNEKNNKNVDNGPLIEIVDLDVFNSKGERIYFIHNGHHRATAILLYGNRELVEEEYNIVERSLNDYIHPKFPHWLTPFNPLTEFRLCEFQQFKNSARKFYETQGELVARNYINVFSPLYKRLREYYTLEEMAKRYIQN